MEGQTLTEAELLNSLSMSVIGLTMSYMLQRSKQNPDADMAWNLRGVGNFFKQINREKSGTAPRSEQGDSGVSSEQKERRQEAASWPQEAEKRSEQEGHLSEPAQRDFETPERAVVSVGDDYRAFRQDLMGISPKRAGTPKPYRGQGTFDLLPERRRTIEREPEVSFEMDYPSVRFDRSVPLPLPVQTSAQSQHRLRPMKMERLRRLGAIPHGSERQEDLAPGTLCRTPLAKSTPISPKRNFPFDSLGTSYRNTLDRDPGQDYDREFSFHREIAHSLQFEIPNVDQFPVREIPLRHQARYATVGPDQRYSAKENLTNRFTRSQIPNTERSLFAKERLQLFQIERARQQEAEVEISSPKAETLNITEGTQGAVGGVETPECPETPERPVFYGPDTPPHLWVIEPENPDFVRKAGRRKKEHPFPRAKGEMTPPGCPPGTAWGRYKSTDELDQSIANFAAQKGVCDYDPSIKIDWPTFLNLLMAGDLISIREHPQYPYIIVMYLHFKALPSSDRNSGNYDDQQLAAHIFIEMHRLLYEIKKNSRTAAIAITRVRELIELLPDELKRLFSHHFYNSKFISMLEHIRGVYEHDEFMRLFRS